MRKRILLYLLATIILSFPLGLGASGCSPKPPERYELYTWSFPAEGGNVSPSTSSYEEGTIVTLTATAAPGYRFENWGEDAQGMSATATVQMTDVKSAYAYFVRQYSLHTSSIPADAGSVTPSSGLYDAGSLVTVQAKSTGCYIFDHWVGNISRASSNWTFRISADTELEAHFTRLCSPTPDLDPEKLCQSYTEYADGTKVFYPCISLENNPNARNPSWSELVNFLKQDDTDKHLYVLDQFDCGEFALMLHNNAERAGWRAAFVSFAPYATRPGVRGHACVAFQTSDCGLIYIDSTGSRTPTNCSMDKVAHLQIGDDYVTRNVFEEPGCSSYTDWELKVASIWIFEW